MTADEPKRSVYDLLIELDQLEELREELEERDLRTIEEVEQRIEDLSAQVERLETDESRKS